ncbi:hypothetical protein [Aquirhabdus parva]|uniref:hypothetical protein n=1 Tax=Aquirhabdus parva TaxID=2283318 RepID=UPI0013B3FCF2|nr:hypothetical protein [Aquirhabdus parva]
MSYRYIVSKKSFFSTLTNAAGMLDSLGRFSSPQPFSHRYRLYAIRSYSKADPESWLKQTYILDIADWMIGLENDPYTDLKPESKLTKYDVLISIQSDRFINAESFIKTQLNTGLIKLVPETNLRERFEHSNALVAWKVADQLMFMSDGWNWNLPAWYISLKTARYESHIMCIAMKFGLVFINFYYPTANHALNKESPRAQINVTHLH